MNLKQEFLDKATANAKRRLESFKAAAKSAASHLLVFAAADQAAAAAQADTAPHDLTMQRESS